MAYRITDTVHPISLTSDYKIWSFLLLLFKLWWHKPSGPISCKRQTPSLPYFFFFFCISDIAFVFSETVPPVLLPQLSGPAAALLSLTLMRTVGTTVLHRWLSPLLLSLTLGSAWYSSKKVEQAQEHNWGQGVTVNKSFQKALEYQKRSVIDRVTYTAISSGYSEMSTVWTSSEWYKPRSSGNSTTTRCPMSYKRQSTAQSVISLNS